MGTTIRRAFGTGLVAAGVLAIPIPVIPGIPLILAGVALLGSNDPLVRSCRKWLRSKGFLETREEPK